ncbi:unnamed protein product, partial [Ixodes pacificus]
RRRRSRLALRDKALPDAAEATHTVPSSLPCEAGPLIGWGLRASERRVSTPRSQRHPTRDHAEVRSHHSDRGRDRDVPTEPKRPTVRTWLTSQNLVTWATATFSRGCGNTATSATLLR